MTNDVPRSAPGSLTFVGTSGGDAEVLKDLPMILSTGFNKVRKGFDALERQRVNLKVAFKSVRKNVGRLAKELGISPRQARGRLRQFGIPIPLRPG